MQAIHQSLSILLPKGSGDMTETKQGAADSVPSLSQDRTSIDVLSDQLLKQSSEADRALRSTLTASGRPPQDVDAQCLQLQLSLANAERAIHEIEHRAEKLEVSTVVR
jgi:hypothetical protein